MKAHTLGLVALVISGCGSRDLPAVTAADTACLPGTAQIIVGDTFLQAGCGCQETNGQPVLPPAVLTCTVTSPATISFIYSSAINSHQIISTSVPSFPSSPLSDSSEPIPTQLHVVQIEAPGSYSFLDAVNTSLSGTLVLQ